MLILCVPSGTLFPFSHRLRVTFPCSVVNNLLSCSERAILRYESGLNSLYLAPFHNQLQALPACMQPST